jgi:hypothetical protein
MSDINEFPTERPTLNFVSPLTEEHISLAFGYIENQSEEFEPFLAVFRGEENSPIVIPRDVLETALKQGWGPSFTRYETELIDLLKRIAKETIGDDDAEMGEKIYLRYIDLWNKLITTVQEYEDAITGGRQRFHDEEEADGN